MSPNQKTKHELFGVGDNVSVLNRARITFESANFIFLLEGGAHVSEVQAPSIRAEGSPLPSGFFFELFLSGKRGAARTARKEPGCWRLLGLCLSVCLVWLCSQQWLIHYTRPQGLVPGERIPWKGFRCGGEGLRSEPVGRPGLPCAEQLWSSY